MITNNGLLRKKAILGKTLQFGVITFLSRILGLIREILQARYLGLTELSDAFIIAFKLPNSLRKIFAEGALSSVFIPTFVTLIHQNDKKTANSLMTLGFIFFEGILIILCLLVFIFPKAVIFLFAPGFNQEQFVHAVKYLKILISFIVFISSSALLAAALNSVNHFLIPASGSVLLNIGFIGALIAALKYNFDVSFLCYAILGSGICVFITHLIAYFYYNFSFGIPTKKIWPIFKNLLIKFGPVCFCMSISEINFILDTAVASYLQPGTVSLVNYAYRFVHIPYGVFGVAASTVLLPHFAKIACYAPKRLSFYLLEAMKFIFWVIFPIIIFMSLFSDKIFTTTIAMSGKFPINRLAEAQGLLIAFLSALIFFCLNKILLNIYYSFHNTKTPTIISIISTLINLIGIWILTKYIGSIGLAVGTAISAISQSILLIIFLKKEYNFTIYLKQFNAFVKRYVYQALSLLGIFVLIYLALIFLINKTFAPNISFALINKFYFWLWVGPLIGLYYISLLRTRKYFKIKIYFLD